MLHVNHVERTELSVNERLKCVFKGYFLLGLSNSKPNSEYLNIRLLMLQNLTTDKSARPGDQ